MTGKPVLLADVNTMTDRPKKGQIDTTEYERSAGKHTLEYYLNAAGSKCCIGVHRCTVRDSNRGTQSTTAADYSRPTTHRIPSWSTSRSTPTQRCTSWYIEEESNLLTFGHASDDDSG